MTPPLSASQATSSSSFLRTLRTELAAALVPEMELTLRVAVLSAAGRTRPAIVRELNSTDIEVRMALKRLEKVADTWK